MMNRIFDMDNPLWRFLGKLADLMILNVLFLLCSIPIFTIGASLTGVNYVCLKIREQEEGYIVRNFFKSFKQNFVQSTIIWLIMLALGLLLGTEFYMYRDTTGTLARVIKGMIVVGAVMWTMVFFAIWPMQARFYNSIKNTFINAILVAFANAPRSFAMIGLLIGVLFICTRNEFTISYGALYWILLGFAVQILANVYLIYPIIEKLMPEKTGDELTPDNRFNVDENADFSALGYTSIPEEEFRKMHEPQPEPPKDTADTEAGNPADAENINTSDTESKDAPDTEAGNPEDMENKENADNTPQEQ